MEDIGFFKQDWKWLESQKHVYSKAKTAVAWCRDKMVVNGEALAYGLQWVCWFRQVFEVGFGLLERLFGERVSVMYPIGSSFVACHDVELFPQLHFHALLALCAFEYGAKVAKQLLMGAAGAAVQYLGYTLGLFIVGLFGILVLWMYANFWITGTLFIVVGYLFSVSHARLIVLIATVYSVYCVKVRVGWHGVFLSMNLAFLSNDVNYLLQCFDNASENTHFEDQKEPRSVMEDDLPGECEYSIPTDEPKKVHQCKSSSKSATTSIINQKELTAKRVVKEETSSTDEMKRILNSTDHYEALGFPRHVKIDAGIMKKEYRKKAMLVHPDKNMGSPLASESFKKLQCAYEVLSDSMKKRDYDEQLRKEESKTRSVCQKSHSSTRQQSTSDHRSEESRRIQCTKCGNSHIWVCTNRNKAKARWCQDCCQYHQAKDGDGWVEYKGSLVFNRPQKMEIPRAFVCAESKIFDVSEWAICQGMACRPNTHRPSFHVNMVGVEKTQRSKPSRYPWDLDAEMIDEDEEEFELWLQQALDSGLFCETCKRRKSWSPFKLPQKKSKKQWRRSST